MNRGTGSLSKGSPLVYGGGTSVVVEGAVYGRRRHVSFHRNPVYCSARVDQMPGNPYLVQLVESIFTFPPIFKMAAGAARKKIVNRGREMGLDFAAEIQALQAVADWDARVDDACDPDIRFPDYYTVPFHAYENGNLSIEAALEVTCAAKSVHATIYDPDGKSLDPEGDSRLRSTYSSCMKALLEEQNAREIKDVIDFGAATGLSSVALLEAFPNASQVVALDLSPYFIAVGNYIHEEKVRTGELVFLHGAAEDTKLDDESFDLVSMCLLLHELPESAARRIFKEAARLLRPGGALSIMEMNPRAPAFSKIMSNAIPYAIFKATEPHLLSYVGMDMNEAIMDAGFMMPKQLENSPRHKTVVAIKQ